ncbi:MAG: hypothetical protein A2571_01225 [Candidatus Vogelbacteria bacterium RIFOXYD1_FULL_44_32]|uniref:Peptidoglycan binding-like domain-containing protein n=1 Tax=Candidatus Vogelbacteria bacterium RIFOXYD1_FULL_44_32 TaxID=1802438 RepID=A0A1G2QG84_9BACT|nr:MAG: hypothetical protein A2571_01225 [Candidatus Vogelbacteria bacterium RIFOXYD1_FULL_44_32]
MIKIFTKSFLFLFFVFSLGLLVVPSVEAATTDFVADGDITVASVVYNSLTADLLILNGSKAEIWNFDSSNFIVTNPDPSAQFKVGSSDASVKSIRTRLTTGDDEVCANNTTPGTSYVTVPTQGAYFVYPSSDSCTTASSGGTGGGGGGGNKKAKPVTSAIPAVPGVSSAVPASPALANASAQASFNRALTVGSTGADVKSLQQFLNSHGFAVASVGAGSPGLETTLFGPATKAAVLKFQLANGVVLSASDLGAGRMGPLTMAKINGLLNGGVPVSVGATSREEQVKSLIAELELLKSQWQAYQASH